MPSRSSYLASNFPSSKSFRTGPTSPNRASCIISSCSGSLTSDESILSSSMLAFLLNFGYAKELLSLAREPESSRSLLDESDLGSMIEPSFEMATDTYDHSSVALQKMILLCLIGLDSRIHNADAILALPHSLTEMNLGIQGPPFLEYPRSSFELPGFYLVRLLSFSIVTETGKTRIQFIVSLWGRVTLS